MTTMDDRTLIERAAKAAGIEPPGGEHSIHNDGRLWDCQRLRWWNPLTDDGDIARLEADCEIDVGWTAVGVCSLNRQSGDAFFERYADHNGDKQKARRYASTRAAASLAMGE